MSMLFYDIQGFGSHDDQQPKNLYASWLSKCCRPLDGEPGRKGAHTRSSFDPSQNSVIGALPDAIDSQPDRTAEYPHHRPREEQMMDTLLLRSSSLLVAGPMESDLEGNTPGL
ncbi:hypothetical protein MJO28_015960 [Puccinia striiformis f. sp. tritici]|nr:hypothetical protein MJO28_015960 [Puccinia striiformis f. sp. tritici]